MVSKIALTKVKCVEESGGSWGDDELMIYGVLLPLGPLSELPTHELNPNPPNTAPRYLENGRQSFSIGFDDCNTDSEFDVAVSRGFTIHQDHGPNLIELILFVEELDGSGSAGEAAAERAAGLMRTCDQHMEPGTWIGGRNGYPMMPRARSQQLLAIDLRHLHTRVAVRPQPVEGPEFLGSIPGLLENFEFAKRVMQTSSSILDGSTDEGNQLTETHRYRSNCFDSTYELTFQYSSFAR